MRQFTSQFFSAVLPVRNKTHESSQSTFCVHHLKVTFSVEHGTRFGLNEQHVHTSYIIRKYHFYYSPPPTTRQVNPINRTSGLGLCIVHDRPTASNNDESKEKHSKSYSSSNGYNQKTNFIGFSTSDVHQKKK